MSVAYEPRSFLHESPYPPMDEEHEHDQDQDHDQDHGAEQRYTDSDVAEHLSHYTADASLMGDDRLVGGDDDVDVDDRIGGVEAAIMAAPEDECAPPDDAAAPLVVELDGKYPSPIPESLPLREPSIPEPMTESKEPSPGMGSEPSVSSRAKHIVKPERDVVKQADGKFHCPLEDCREEVRSFSRRCEWNKHMDKHERPYRCPAAGCENLPGFTYSGGLLRHEREVHRKHGGPKHTVNCPHPNCKRHTGKGFSRQENLNEHLRRVHTNSEGGGTPPATMGVAAPIVERFPSPDENNDKHESERASLKRKRRWSGQSDDIAELRDEIKRVRQENDKLKTEIEQQSQRSLAMMAQIAELQEALHDGLGQNSLGAPTAQMI